MTHAPSNRLQEFTLLRTNAGILPHPWRGGMGGGEPSKGYGLHPTDSTARVTTVSAGIIPGVTQLTKDAALAHPFFERARRHSQGYVSAPSVPGLWARYYGAREKPDCFTYNAIPIKHQAGRRVSVLWDVFFRVPWSPTEGYEGDA